MALHIELDEINKEKFIPIGKALGSANRALNEFCYAIDAENFITTMQELMRTERSKIKIMVIPIDSESKKK